MAACKSRIEPANGSAHHPWRIPLFSILATWSRPSPTNDRYISTMHRVINTSGVDRYSVPFFIGLDFDAVMWCLAASVQASPVSTSRTLMFSTNIRVS